VKQETGIVMDDGVRLAATLYLPDTDRPQPCLLEALPYRKDDLTLSYADEYERLRADHGYAVCRLDLRGTGSSEGIATDEYPRREQDDLVAVIAWLAAQDWCDGNVGMWGTSYSGFNAIQVAACRPPALKAIVPIYATDDRYADDVHYMGGALRLLDVVDYPTYMIAMNALPPVPSLDPNWREHWLDRVERTEPWLLRWIREQHDGPYWRHGSLRPGYERVAVPTMIVAGWADGYRNNSFRTFQALTAAGTPTRLLIGPWAHMAPRTARPGPNVDLLPEMVRWFDRWLRGEPTADPGIVYFARHSSEAGPAPDALTIDGEWLSLDTWPPPDADVVVKEWDGARTHKVRPDTGTAAWNSCAGQLPWGLPTDQRFDDAASLTWDWMLPDELALLGQPRLALRITADQPVASLSAKLCDVAEDGTSTLITRGFLNLTHRAGSERPEPLPVGVPVAVQVELEATAYTLAPGRTLRLSVTGVDWPNTAAPPRPVTLTIHSGQLSLPAGRGTPVAMAHEPPGEVPADPVTWQITDDVLARVTTARTAQGGTFDVAYGGRMTERYSGQVTVDRRTWRQTSTSTAAFDLTWPGVSVGAAVTVALVADAEAYTVDITLTATENDARVAQKRWNERIPRQLG